MLELDQAAAIFADAWSLHADAMRMLAQGEIRNAADYETLVGRYFTRISYLHGSCFYNGMCDPVHTERHIRETADYIRNAETLAS